MTRQLRALVAIVSALIFTALSGCTQKVQITYPEVPTTLALRPTTTTTIGPDRSKQSLLPTPDSALPLPTTTVDFGAGSVTLAGRVLGPDGPVPGASVRIERIVGNSTAERTVFTDKQGRFTLRDVPGGRLRLRAWKVPNMAMARNVVVFASGTTTVVLKAERFTATDVRWAAAPSLPIEGQAVNLVVQVSRRRVDDSGVIGFEQITGLAVRLIPLGSLQPDGAAERLTDDSGRASFPMRCNAAGPAQIRAQLASGEDATLDLPACLPLPTTTLAPPPPSTEPPTVAPIVAPDSTTIAP